MQGKLVVEVNEFDVFFGRGKRAFFRPGNVNFRRLAKEKSCIFHGANGAEPNTKTKTELAREIMNEIEASGGRFLRPVTASNVHGSVCSAWEVVLDEVALMKTKQAMRDSWSKSKPKKTNMVPKGRPLIDQQYTPSKCKLLQSFEYKIESHLVSLDAGWFTPAAEPQALLSAIPSHSQAALGFPPSMQLQLLQHGLPNSPSNPFGFPYANSLQSLWLGGMVQGMVPNQQLYAPGRLMLANQLGGTPPKDNLVPALVVVGNPDPGALPASTTEKIQRHANQGHSCITTVGAHPNESNGTL